MGLNVDDVIAELDPAERRQVEKMAADEQRREPHRVEPLERGVLERSVEKIEAVDIDPRSHHRTSPQKEQGPLRVERPLSRQHAAWRVSCPQSNAEPSKAIQDYAPGPCVQCSASGTTGFRRWGVPGDACPAILRCPVVPAERHRAGRLVDAIMAAWSWAKGLPASTASSCFASRPASARSSSRSGTDGGTVQRRALGRISRTNSMVSPYCVNTIVCSYQRSASRPWIRTPIHDRWPPGAPYAARCAAASARAGSPVTAWRRYGRLSSTRVMLRP